MACALSPKIGGFRGLIDGIHGCRQKKEEHQAIQA